MIGGVTTRSDEKAAAFAAHGFKPFIFDGTSNGQGIDAALYRTTHLLISIAPGGEDAGDAVLHWYKNEIVHSAPALRWIGYLSTVGVYGDHAGQWVDEDSEPQPVSRRSQQRVVAERKWQEAAKERGVPLAILRLSGIYGPGRNAFTNLMEGKARRLIKPGQIFNRIHVDDIAGVLHLLMREDKGGIFNVTDSEPAPPQDVVTYASEMADIIPPPEQDFETAELSPMARSFYGESKRVSNRRVRELGYKFRYPTYREGLRSLFEAGETQKRP
ncbi:SDR family oxidoreductase [Aureimonas fodinaquatilis]